MFLFSATFFPISVYPVPDPRIVIEATPLFHAVSLLRGLATGLVGWRELWDLATSSPSARSRCRSPSPPGEAPHQVGVPVADAAGARSGVESADARGASSDELRPSIAAEPIRLVTEDLDLTGWVRTEGQRMTDILQGSEPVPLPPRGREPGLDGVFPDELTLVRASAARQPARRCACRPTSTACRSAPGATASPGRPTFRPGSWTIRSSAPSAALPITGATFTPWQRPAAEAEVVIVEPAPGRGLPALLAGAPRPAGSAAPRACTRPPRRPPARPPARPPEADRLPVDAGARQRTAGLASKASSSAPSPRRGEGLALAEPARRHDHVALAASCRTPWTTSSRTRSVAAIQVDSSDTSTMAISAPATSTLSAVRSRKMPSGLPPAGARHRVDEVGQGAPPPTQHRTPAGRRRGRKQQQRHHHRRGRIAPTPSMFGSDVSRPVGRPPSCRSVARCRPAAARVVAVRRDDQQPRRQA